MKTTIESILKNDMRARESDLYLFARVCVESGMSVETARLIYRELKKMPDFETVRRTRQKAQADNPLLKPCKEVQAVRNAKEVRYHSGVFE